MPWFVFSQTNTNISVRGDTNRGERSKMLVIARYEAISLLRNSTKTQPCPIKGLPKNMEIASEAAQPRKDDLLMKCLNLNFLQFLIYKFI